MHGTTGRGHRGDGNGWLIIGGLAAMGGLSTFLMYLVSEMRNVGASGAFGILGIGIAGCGAFAAIALGPIGRAVGKRLLEGGRGEIPDETADLHLQVDDLRSALIETQERLDFTERMIAGAPERAREELH